MDERQKMGPAEMGGPRSSADTADAIPDDGSANGAATGEGQPEANHDVMLGGTLGVFGGAVVGAIAGGPVGAVIGAMICGGTSAAAVDIIDTHDHTSPGPAHHPRPDEADEVKN